MRAAHVVATTDRGAFGPVGRAGAAPLLRARRFSYALAMRRSSRSGRFARLYVAGVAALLAIGRPAGPVSAEPDAPATKTIPATEDGSTAPPWAWTQDDGCPSRSGTGSARPIRGALERAWKFTLKEGTLEGEPLVWKERAFLVEKGAKRRILHVVSTATGIERASWVFDTSEPLHPCVGPGRVLVKTSATTVEAFGVGDSTLTRRWRIAAQESLGPPTLFHDEIYLVRDGVLERWAYGGVSPVWPKAADAAGAVRIEKAQGSGGAAGAAPVWPRPSMRGASVFVTSGASILEVDRASGALKGRADLEVEADPATSKVVVTARDVVVVRTGPASGKVPESVHFARSQPGTMDGRTTHTLPAGMAGAWGAWTAVVESEGAKALVAFGAGDTSRTWRLAGGGSHDEFVAAVPPTMVPGCVYLGLLAFELPALGVLRAKGVPVVSRAIPLRGRVLVAETPSVVAAWREVRAAVSAPIVAPSGAAAGASISIKAGRAALDDGRILDGPFVYDAKAATLRASGPGQGGTVPLRALRVVLAADAPRRVVLALRADDAASGVAAVLASETAKDLVALVAPALAAGDVDLAQRALSLAGERGASEADTGPAAAAIVAFEAKPTPRDDAKAAEVEAKLSAAVARVADGLVEVANAMPADAPIPVAVALVRLAGEYDRKHAGAGAWIRSHVPKGLPLPEELRLAEWLDFIEVRSTLAVRVWGLSKDNRLWGSDAEKPSEESELFKRFWEARTMWPGDLDVAAFECGPLVVFTPLERPGAIVKCLALGRLVCDTLDETFKPVAAPRKDSEPLIVHFYSNREEYLRRSRPTGESGVGGEAERGDGLENTAGHYSPGDNVTRMFFPDADEDDPDLPVSGVYAHELTHHWIERRRPGTAAQTENGRERDVPGYFIVEGFADFMRSFVWDVGARRATPDNPRSDYADVLTGIAPEGLIPWDTLLRTTQGEFQKLSMATRIPVARRWRLGPVGSTVPKVLFYDQASAVCAYLWLAEGQKHRKALLDFVYAWYTGKASADTLEKSTGMKPEELGKRVLAWCREQVKKG